jgi:hypothetical protein
MAQSCLRAEGVPGTGLAADSLPTVAQLFNDAPATGGAAEIPFAVKQGLILKSRSACAFFTLLIDRAGA